MDIPIWILALIWLVAALVLTVGWILGATMAKRSQQIEATDELNQSESHRASLLQQDDKK